MKIFKSILVMGVLFLFNACSPKIATKIPTVFYPESEDSAKLQFLKTFNYSTDIEGKQTSFNKALIGDVEASSIKKPYGVDYYKGKIYVCDLGIEGIVEIDLVSNKFTPINPKGSGKLDMPLNISIDEEGNKYIIDISLRKVLVYDENFNYMLSFGKGELGSPTDIAIGKDKIWVTDISKHNISAFDRKTKKLLFSFPETVEGNDDWLYKPSSIDVSEDKIYVTDAGDGGIKVFSKKGEFIKKIGSFGKQLGQFLRPKGIALDKEENLYAVDGALQNVQIFNSDGKLLLFFGGATNTYGGMYLPTAVAVSYDIELFKKYVDPRYELKYLIFQINQYGNHKVNVYGRIEPK